MIFDFIVPYVDDVYFIDKIIRISTFLVFFQLWKYVALIIFNSGLLNNNIRREQFDDNFKLLHSFKVNRCIFNKVNWAYVSMMPVTRWPF